MRYFPIGNRDLAGFYEFRRVPVGSKIWFEEEKQGYTVRASNVAFVVLTKPFNAKKTVLYTAIDWESGLRGPENLIFGSDAKTDVDCADMLQRLTMGDTELSGRHSIPVRIVKYENPRLKQGRDSS